MVAPFARTYSVASGPINGGRFPGGLMDGAVALGDASPAGSFAMNQSAMAGAVALGDLMPGGELVGKVVPAWLPASGQRSSVSLNTVSSVYPTTAPDTRTRGSTAVMYAWCGTVYASALGSLGSIIAWGGGHGDYVGNEVYSYDLATRLWSRICDPFDIPVSYALGTQQDDVADGNGTGTGVSSTTHGEYWTDDTKSAEVVGQKCSAHTYGHLVYVPPAQAGNNKGWVVIVGNFNKQCHKLDLDTPSSGWARLGPLMNASTESPAYGCSIVDTSRNRIACFPWVNGAQSIGHTVALPAGSVGGFSQNYLNVYYSLGKYSVADDLYLLMRVGVADDGNGLVQVHDPASGTKYKPAHSGATPPWNTAGTVEWIESTRQLVYWPGSGNTVYFGQAPANPRTGTWVWTSRDFTGDSPATSVAAWPLYYRFHYVPSLDAIVHVGATTGPVQAWKL